MRPPFSSSDSYDMGMIIVVEPEKVQLMDFLGNPEHCYVREGVAMTHIPTYTIDSGTGQRYTSVREIRVAEHTYLNTHCADAPNYAPDGDLDGIADALEDHYGTFWSGTHDPHGNCPDYDSDCDGLNDGLEVLGTTKYWDFGTNPATYEWAILHDMQYAGASPLRRDLFVQWDYQTATADSGGMISGAPPIQLKDFLLTFFHDPGMAQSNQLLNPDGTNGLAIHITTGESFGNTNPPTGPGTHIETLGCGVHEQRVHQRREWTHVLTTFGFRRYQANDGSTLSGVSNEGLNCSTDGTGSVAGQYLGRDCAAGLSYDHVICDWPRNTSVPAEDDQRVHEWAYTFLHELGHNLNLPHGGSDDLNGKPNYWSLMNYDRFFQGSGTDGDFLSNSYIQFSDGANASIDESAPSETDPFALGPGGQLRYGKFLGNIGWMTGVYQSPAWGYVDWDTGGSHTLGTLTGTELQSDSGDAGFQVLDDYNDYDQIKQGLSDLMPWTGASFEILGEARPDDGKAFEPYPNGFVPGEDDLVLTDPEIEDILIKLTGKRGKALERFLASAGIDPSADMKLLQAFRTARKGTKAIELAARELYPDGVPAYVSNKGLEADVRAVIGETLDKEIGYAPEIEFVDCPKQADTPAKLSQLVEALRSAGGRNHGTPVFMGSETLEEAVPVIPETGRLTFCR